MKANIPTSYLNLPKKEKTAIDKVIVEYIQNQVNHEEAELQKIWIQFACIVLHDAFGFGKDRLTTFIGNWKRMYRRNKRLNGYDEQMKFLNAEMEKIFGKDGFPREWVDKLEEI